MCVQGGWCVLYSVFLCVEESSGVWGGWKGKCVPFSFSHFLSAQAAKNPGIDRNIKSGAGGATLGPEWAKPKENTTNWMEGCRMKSWWCVAGRWSWSLDEHDSDCYWSVCWMSGDGGSAGWVLPGVLAGVVLREPREP